jgi:hypothetical protein
LEPVTVEGAKSAFLVISNTSSFKEFDVTFTRRSRQEAVVSRSAEYWHRAENLVKLAAAATQLYARETLLERAAEFRQMAEVSQLSRGSRDERARYG